MSRYSELIHVLYSTNTFFFHKPHHLAYFAQFNLPQRVQSLTSIDVVYSCADMFHADISVTRARLEANHKLYAEACEILAGLSNLRKIRLSVPSPGLGDSADSSGLEHYSDGLKAALKHLWLQPMDTLVQRRGDLLKTAELWMPESYFLTIDTQGEEVVDAIRPRVGPHPDWYNWQKFLREVDGGPGYWIHSRPDGALLPPICTLQGPYRS
jgi:hypothetical protein